MSGNDQGRRNDDELIDSLYAEGDRPDAPNAFDTLDAASGEAGGAGEADALDRELAQLRQLRGMFAELKANQAEPPPEGMAFLMAAARQAAAARKATAEDGKQAGLWARLRAGWQAMVAHPAMAAAAAAVVVIGASGYLMSRGVGKQVESTYSSADQVEAMSPRVEEQERRLGDEAASSASATPALEPAQAPAAPEPIIPMAGDGDMAGGLGTGSASAPGGAASPASMPAPADDKETLRPRRAGKGEKSKLEAAADVVPSSEGRDGKGAGPVGGKDVTRDKLDESFAKQNSDAAAAPSGTSAPAAQAPSPPPPPPPPPPSPVTKAMPKKPAAAVDRGGGESEIATEAAPEEEAPAPSKPSRVESVSQQAERWYQLARDEAAKGNCKQVKLLAERVKTEDMSFYENRFRKDPSLQKCL